MKMIKSTDGISPWKIDNPVERVLSNKAVNSFFWKKIYVQFYKMFDREYFEKGLTYIDKNIAMFKGEVTPDVRKRYITDMVYSLHRHGCMFDEYFLYNFPNLSEDGRQTFITDKIRWSYYRRMNSDEENAIFNDKKKAFDKFGKYYKRDLILITDESDKEMFLEFVHEHKTFIIKPYNSSGGRGVCMKTVSNDTEAEDCFNELITNDGGTICEEVIKQSDKMASIHPSSVNTVRFTTIKDNHGVHVFHPLLRTGVGNSIIDNATGGGIFALINPESGIIFTEAKDEKGNSFILHPNTKIAFPGFELPDWEGAKKLAEELANITKNHYVGWDLAHTEKGWVVVEGNPRGQMIMMQLFFKDGFKKEVETYINNI